MTGSDRGEWGGYGLRRQRMADRLAAMGIRHPAVLGAVAAVPRHLFVEEALHSRAYDDLPLPLGLGQTISRPYTVAVMTQLLLGKRPAEDCRKVLEIGTGCGYQTAVLQAAGFRDIYSIERLRPLHEQAKKNLRAVRMGNARLICGDGYLGLEREAPFDAVLVTAAPTAVPEALLHQLAVGGRMVLPLEDKDKGQFLWVIEKTEHGYWETQVREALFVPLVAGDEKI